MKIGGNEENIEKEKLNRWTHTQAIPIHFGQWQKKTYSDDSVTCMYNLMGINDIIT